MRVGYRDGRVFLCDVLFSPLLVWVFLAWKESKHEWKKGHEWKRIDLCRHQGKDGRKGRKAPLLFYIFSCFYLHLDRGAIEIVVESWAIEHCGVVSVRAERFFPSSSYALVIELFSVALILVFSFRTFAPPIYRYFARVSSTVIPLVFYFLHTGPAVVEKETGLNR